MLPILFILPLFVLPFFDRTLQELPFVYFLAAQVLLLPALIIHLKNSDFRPNRIICWLFGGLIIQIFISVIFSYSVAVPYSTVGMMLIVSALAWYLLGSAATPEIKKALAVMVVSVAAVLAAVSYLIIFKVLPAPASSVNLLTWTFGHHRLAGYLLFPLPVLVWAVSQDWRWKKPAILGLVLILPIFLISGGRAAYLGLLASLIYLQKRSILKGYSLTAAILVGLLFFLSVPIFYRLRPELSVFQFVSNYRQAAGVLIKPLSADSRFDYWSQAARAIVNDPLGYGLETFRFQTLFFRRAGENISGYVHNQYLQMFAETGIIGGGLFLALVITALKQGHRAAAESGDRMTTALLAGLIGSAVAAIFDFDWQFPSIFLLFWLIAGIVGRDVKTELIENKQSTAWAPLIMLFFIPAIYGGIVWAGLAGLPMTTKFWGNGGKEFFGNTAGIFSSLHPKLEEEIFETGKGKMAPADFSAFIKRQFPLYQYDNQMLAGVLEWQKYFGSKQDVITTAAVILDNDPLDQQAQQTLQEAAE